MRSLPTRILSEERALVGTTTSHEDVRISLAMDERVTSLTQARALLIRRHPYLKDKIKSARLVTTLTHTTFTPLS